MRLISPRQCFISLTLLLISFSMIGLLTGPVMISPDVLLDMLRTDNSDTHAQEQLILASIRLPRLLLALLIGALLSSCGAALQGLFRNALADPTLLGVSAGASAGASCVIVFGALWLPSLSLGLSSISIGAFCGGLCAALIVYRLANTREGTSIATMLLAGVAISALAGALNQLFSFIADNDKLRQISLWQMGSLDTANWQKVLFCFGVVSMLIVLLPRESRALNAILLGESEARHLGVGVEWLKRRLIIYCSLGVGVSVAVAGTIAFVGLVIPHLIRMLIGPDHRYLIPASAMAGALLLVVADAVARIVVAPAELPIGVVTALLGAPFFVSLLLQQRGAIHA